MKNAAEISIIVPAFNEAENIPLLVEATRDMMQDSNLACELIIVDDGSCDNTYDVARSLQKQHRFVKIVRHVRNRGITDALLSGFEHAAGGIYVFYPADLQYDPREIPALVEPLRHGADIVTGWKTGQYEKKFVSSVYNALSRWLFKVPVHDLNSVKAFKREVAETLPMRRDWHRYMVVIAAQEGYHLEEVRMTLHKRRHGRSKFGFWRIPVGVLDLIAVKLQTTFGSKPMLLFGSLGTLSIGAGMITGLIALYLRIVHGIGFRPLLYLVILLVLAGLSLFALGFLGEAIASVSERLARVEKKIQKSK
ncbi:MAG: glycosyltransferase family 2 protein [candidate division WOR-3 bacterium]|nr:MAG: glycosyltransferase family 2 protein [candidate division WOR-3 bacterium]